MTFFPSLQQQLDTLHRLLGEAPLAGSIPERLHQLSDEELTTAAELIASTQQQIGRFSLAIAGVTAQRANMRLHVDA